MIKTIRKIAMLSMIGCLSFNCFTAQNVSAAIARTSIEQQAKTLDFSNMSIQELDDYITSIRLKNTTPKASKSIKKSTAVYAANNSVTDLKLAWLAAAAIANQKGYPCASTLVKYSVWGINYSEDSGAFSDKIKTSSVYKKWTRDPKNTSIAFEKNDNADLFYALHNVNIHYSGNSQGIRVNVSDVFDFALDNNYDSLFTSSVNNWAWLCQNIGVLTDINVSISFNG